MDIALMNNYYDLQCSERERCFNARKGCKGELLSDVSKKPHIHNAFWTIYYMYSGDLKSDPLKSINICYLDF